MKKNFMKYSILIWAWMILWVVASNIWNVFGAQDPGQGNPNVEETIVNTACIEYTTPSWTGIKCDDVIVHYKTWSSQGHRYFITKRQKTWGMANFTTWEIVVEPWEYIQYKVDFGSITWTCKKWTIEDTLPSCVRYVSSSIVWVSWPSLATGEHFVQYSGFRLNSNSSWYILVTGQIIGNAGCEDTTRYVNTWSFKCWDPSSNWMRSSVVARRKWWGWWSWSEVLFEKTWNKTEMVPWETWLKFTITVNNKWPNAIYNVYVDDIWPGNNDCIQYVRWSGNNVEYLWSYKRHYNKWTWVLWVNKSFTFDIYASVVDSPSCVWAYINTWKLTYEEWWKSHILYDNHQFIVKDGWVEYDVSIEKTADREKVSRGGPIEYTIIYKNEWTKPLTGYRIVDNWPYNDILVVGQQSIPAAREFINNFDTLTWVFSWVLAPWGTGKIIIQGTVRER